MLGARILPDQLVRHVLLDLSFLLACGAGPSPFTPDASGTLTQTLFSTAGPANIAITIRNVLLGPQGTAQIAALPGPALLEWVEGHGTIAIAGGPPQALGDQTRVILAGQSLSLSNLNPQPMAVRLYIFTGD